jgi:hypothetical protein
MLDMMIFAFRRQRLYLELGWRMILRDRRLHLGRIDAGLPNRPIPGRVPRR